MIRVTNNQMYKTALRSVMGARGRMQDAQRVALTGERVARPSDDPAAAARARVLASLKTASESHIRTISDGVSRLQRADDSLSSVSASISRARELAQRGANPTYTAPQRAAMAAEISQIRSQVIDQINTNYLGEYVFAQVNTRTAPYDTAAGGFSYDVDVYDQVRKVEVGPAQLGEIGASGSIAFAARAADPTSIDLPAMLAGLEADMLANDGDLIRANLDTLERAFSQVLNEQARVGVRVQRLRQAEAAASQAKNVYTTLRGELVDADAATAFSELTLAETSMQAAVTVASRIMGPSLLDFQ